MSNNSKRPVFVPKHKRRRNETRKPYFHGAFTGGFSAGYYNTVGSKEGWKPSSMMEDDDDNKDDGMEGETGTYNNNNNNTIISRTGGTSSARTRRRNRQPQKIEDFMDEQDHNVWGGPTSIHQEYQTHQQQSMKVSLSGGDKDDDRNDERLSALLIVEPPSNVGHRLLRFLGWRNNNGTTTTTTTSSGNGSGSAAYVPTAGDDVHPSSHDACQNDDDDAGNPTFVIKKKRIRKIQLQQTRVQIPAPKFDSCGLGYRPHRDAPEFERYFEKRRKQARERAQLATTSTTSTNDTLDGMGTGHGGSTNVYRVSHVLGNQGGSDIFNNTITTNNNDDDAHINRRGDTATNTEKGAEDHNISFETIQDFVGTKSVGGFALRDDDDDVYDAEPLQHKASLQHLDREEYDTELYDHHDSEDDENLKGHHHHRNKAVIGNLLSAWASTDQPQDTDDKASTTPLGGGGVTSDGRPPLPGFLLGGGISNNPGNTKELVRFKGPDVPLEYTVKRHEFTEDEYPDAFREISNSMQHRRTLEQKHAVAMRSIVASTAASTSTTNSLSLQQQRQKPLASTTFSGLAVAMKNRFTSSDDAPAKSTTAKYRISSSIPIGLHKPIVPFTKDESKEKESNAQIDSGGTLEKEKEPPQKLSIARTVVTFYPHPLLSKRFGVKGFKRSNAPSNASNVNNKASSTESSFFDNEVLKSAAAAQAERTATSKPTNYTPNEGESEQDTKIDRPSLEKLKSIFESASESDDDDDDDDDDVNSLDDSIQDAPSSKEIAAIPIAAERNPILVENEDSVSILDLQSKIENVVDGQSEGRASSETVVNHGDDSSGKHRRSRRRKIRSKRKSYSTDSDTSTDSDSERRRRRRKRRKERSRKDEKKRRKKHKSSKRK